MLPLQVTRLCKIMCITINSRVWGIDYIAGQTTARSLASKSTQ